MMNWFDRSTWTRYRYKRRRWQILMAVIDALGSVLCWLAQRFRRSREPNTHASVRSILLVQLDHLGDAILTGAMIPALQARWPEARIEVLAAPWNQALFTALHVDTIHLCAQNRFRRQGCWFWPLTLAACGWRLRRRKLDLAIDVRGELPHAALLWLSGAKRRVGWRDGGGAFFLTDALHRQPGQHELVGRRALLNHLGCDKSSHTQIRPLWPIASDTQRAVRSWLDSLDADAGPRIVVHIGAGTTAKRWPVAYFQELLGRLIVELDAQVILVGSKEERSLAEQITAGNAWPRVEDRVGQLTLDELAALCQNVDLFVGADSGPAHLAAAVDCPVMALFSGTNRAEQWRPIGNQVRILQHAVSCAPCQRTTCPLASHPCMQGITPVHVLAAIREWFAPSTLPTSGSRWSRARTEIYEGLKL